MKNTNKFITFVLIFICCCTFSQKQNLDSLWKVYNNDLQADSSRLKAVDALAWFYKANNPDSAILLAESAIKLAQKIDQAKYVGNAYSAIGISYRNKGNYPEALKNYFTALKIREKINDKKGIAASYNNIAIIYENQQNYPEALKNNLAALKIREELHDKSAIAASYNNIGNIYWRQNRFEEALKNYLAVLKIREDMGDKRGISTTFSNIGNVYNSMASFEKNKLQKQKNYNEALQYYISSLKIKEKIKDDKLSFAISYINIGTVYTSLLKSQEAQNYLNKALQLGIESNNKEIMIQSYANLSILDSTVHNYKAAFRHFLLYSNLRDSINNEETKKQTLKAGMQYEFDKKEIAAKAEQDKKDAIVAEEKQRQKIVIVLVSVVLTLVVLFFILLYSRFRVTQKQKQIIEIKEKQTQQQNLIITEQKQLVEEKHKEITDSINYAERIQRSLLASKKTLDENLKDYFILFKPKDVVSGDFYWASKINENSFCLVTADSTGHGVPGAIMSMLNMNSLKEAITKGLNKADDILNYTRTIIINTLANDGSADGGKDGMDCSLLIFNFKELVMDCVAANNPVWIVRQNVKGVELIEVKPQKMPVGKHDKQNIPFIKQTIQLQKGDTIYTLTDGFSDQFGGEKRKKFMTKNLKDFLVANALLPMEKQKKILEDLFEKWIGDLEQIDDVTIVGVRI